VPFDAMVWPAQTAQMPTDATQRCVYDMTERMILAGLTENTEEPCGSWLASDGESTSGIDDD